MSLLIHSILRPVHRENPNAIFASERIENSDDLVDAVADAKINNVG